MSFGNSLVAVLLSFVIQSSARYSIGTRDDILQSAATLAYDTMSFYKGNLTGQIPGILPGPPTEHKGDYYWWEGGALMGTMIDYWHLTGDSSYNDVVMEGMLHQVGEGEDYMPYNHTASLGNDDQGFWGMSAMLAAENKFPNPPEDKPQWLALAEAVWRTQADPARHDDSCGGGMRWQIPFSNIGYNYKNTIANGCFFNIGARLARYTGNDTYAKHAADTWDWLWQVEYIDHEDWFVYDGAHVEKDCTDINVATFSYNAGVLLQGAAFMYNHTGGDELWGSRVEHLLEAMYERFFPNNIAFEPNCEPYNSCSPDMLSFKGYVHRWLAVVSQIAPFTAEKLLPVLKKSTEAAVAQCTGGSSGRTCGYYWFDGNFRDPARDHTSGAGESMNVLGAVMSLLIGDAHAPVTNTTGGISRGDPNAGRGGHQLDNDDEFRPITTADRAGAAVITVVVLTATLGLFWWMSAP